MEKISIALICTILGTVIGIVTFSRNRDKDLKADMKEDAETKAKLNYIVTAVDEIRLDNKARDREMTKFDSRLTRVEESTKSAHKRIDNLEGDV